MLIELIIRMVKMFKQPWLCKLTNEKLISKFQNIFSYEIDIALLFWTSYIDITLKYYYSVIPFNNSCKYL